MSDHKVSRRLAAILSVDVVGFSRLMGVDEEGTLKTLKTCRSEVFDPAIEAHGGRQFKLMGDGALIEFGSVVGAVECAIEMQHKVSKLNQGRMSHAPIRFRIGINLGDVIIDGDDVYGDGVNVVARIEALADPGGICISGSVYDQVKDKIEIGFENLGIKSLKNIKDPVRLYKVLGFGESPKESMGTDVQDKPSVAVLPFVSLGSEPEQEYFSDGISEDIITGLGKINGLMVVAKSSTFTYKNKSVDIKQVGIEQGVRYVLEGSVRKSGNRVRVSAQLNDATSGRHVWAEKYDREIEDIFKLQDELMREIVVALDVQLQHGEQAKIWSSGTDNVEAWECVRISSTIILGTVREQLPRARELLDRALKLDPDYAIAWVMLGWYHQNFVDVAGGIEMVKVEHSPLTEMKDCAERAISIDPDCADAYSLLAMYFMEVNDFDAAEENAEKSVFLAPENAENLMEAIIIQVKNGKPQRALELAERARKLCPILRPGFLRGLALAHRFAGNLDAAADTLNEAVNQQPERLAAHINLASVLGELGRTAEADKVVQHILKVEPGFSIRQYTNGLSYRNPEDLQRVVRGLENVGLPA